MRVLALSVLTPFALGGFWIVNAMTGWLRF